MDQIQNKESHKEIERKFLIHRLPSHMASYPCFHITQGYLCREPVVRVRKENEDYVLTYKGKGLLSHTEYNLPLTKEAFEALIQKCEGSLIQKKRYKIPLPDGHIAEVDLFQGQREGTRLVEVEFTSLEEARSFSPPEWFGEDVTQNPDYHNSNM